MTRSVIRRLFDEVISSNAYYLTVKVLVSYPYYDVNFIRIQEFVTTKNTL